MWMSRCDEVPGVGVVRLVTASLGVKVFSVKVLKVAVAFWGGGSWYLGVREGYWSSEILRMTKR